MSAIETESLSLQEQLAALDAKLDYVVERQRFIEEMIDEMVPVGREVLKVGAERFAELEAKGWFAYANELMRTFDRIVDAYTLDDVKALSDNVVGILDTVRNVTQPDVLAVANDATNVLHTADEVEPVGLFGMVRATRDDDIQRGMAIALRILEQLGQSARDVKSAAPAVRRAPRSAPPANVPPAVPPAREVNRQGPPPAIPRPTPPSTPPAEATPREPEEVVMWEGHAFNPQGYLVNTDEWTPLLGTKIAEGLGIQLTDEHWKVLNWVRQDYLATGASPNVRRTAIGSGVGTAAMYRLFPQNPGKTCAMIAGVPKPVGCV